MSISIERSKLKVAQKQTCAYCRAGQHLRCRSNEIRLVTKTGRAGKRFDLRKQYCCCGGQPSTTLPFRGTIKEDKIRKPIIK